MNENNIGNDNDILLKKNSNLKISSLNYIKNNNYKFLQINFNELKKFYLKSLFLHKILIIIIFLINFFYYFNIKDLSQNKLYPENEIFLKYKNSFLKDNIIYKFNNYIKICNESKLLENQKYSLFKKPKISIMIPIYNGGKYLRYSLRSIQNQKMKNIEIILIDDNSNDNSLILINEYMKEDLRIRLIKNKKNKKILYSKSIGALNSNGNFILELDQDDMFIRDDLFNILFFEATTNNLDLIQIRDFIKYYFYFDKKTKINLDGWHIIYPKETHYKEKDELKDKLFLDNNNYLLWGMLIKTDIYKKAIHNLWPIIINYKIIFNEDYLITSMIVILSNRYKYINIFGLIHLLNSNSASNDYLQNNEYYLSFLFYLNYLNEFYIKNNQKNIKLLINYINIDNKSFLNSSKIFPNFFYYIVNIILKNRYLSKIDKYKFFNKFNIKLDIFKSYDNYDKQIEYNSILKFYNEIINQININNSLHNNLSKSIYNSSYRPNTKNNKYIINKGISYRIRKIEISVIIFCIEYNNIDKTLISIINQIFNNYEIIIIYDNNDKYNYNYIKKFSSNYDNIKIINNFKKKGLLYSYSIGVLNAKGEYILMLQSGYTLSDKNVLHKLYYNSINNNIDILEFNLLINEDDNIKNSSLDLYKCLHFKSKIDLKMIKLNKHFMEIEQQKELLVNKFIRTKTFKNIIYKYKLNIYENCIYNNYEDIIFYLLNKNKIKFKYLNLNGIIQNINDIKVLELTNIKIKKNQIINDYIFYINFLFDNSNETFDDKKYALNEFINILNIIYNKFDKISESSIKLIKKFFNSNYINEEDKSELKFLFYSLIN